MAQLLDDADMEWMRATQADIRPDSGTIYRFTEGTATSDGMGGYDDSEANWLSVGTSSIRVRPMNMRGRVEFETGAQMVSLGRWDLTLDYDAVVTPKDRIKTGDRVYEITRINNDETWLTAVRVEAITYNEETNRG